MKVHGYCRWNMKRKNVKLSNLAAKVEMLMIFLNYERLNDVDVLRILVHQSFKINLQVLKTNRIAFIVRCFECKKRHPAIMYDIISNIFPSVNTKIKVYVINGVQ